MSVSVTSASGFWTIAGVAFSLFMASDARAQGGAASQAAYIIGPRDVLVITSYDQPDLTGKFTVETDGSFTYPLIGRVTVTGMSLREVESALEQELIRQEFFTSPQVIVAIEQYRSKRVYIVGEVRTPGSYAMSGDMRLVEALALAGSTLPTASSAAVIVSAPPGGAVIEPTPARLAAADESEHVRRIDLRQLENGDLSQNVLLNDGDTVFVRRAENVYVFGEVKSPGAYPMRDRQTTVLQALSLAGGVTDRGSMGRLQIVRVVDGQKKEIKPALTDFVEAHDTIVVRQRFF
jgi:polysaccharide export outer membrane protein